MLKNARLFLGAIVLLAGLITDTQATREYIEKSEIEEKPNEGKCIQPISLRKKFHITNLRYRLSYITRTAKPLKYSKM